MLLNFLISTQCGTWTHTWISNTFCVLIWSESLVDEALFVDIQNVHAQKKSHKINTTPDTWIYVLPEELCCIMENLNTDCDDFVNLTEFAAFCRSDAADSGADEFRDTLDLYIHDKNRLLS